MQKFIFDPSKGETPASVARKREIADALLARRSAPRNVGEGLSELGNALAYRAVMGKVRKGEKYGQEQQSSARSALLAELGGGGGSQAPAGPPAFPATAQPVQRAPIDYPSQRVAQAHGDPTVEQMTAYIREAAPGYGVDPDTAVRVARSEGLQPGVWQSNVMKNGQREESYGPFQLFMGGGLGNEFQQQTGLNPADKSTWKQQIDFALSKAKEGGWSPWYGAAKVGVDRWTGLRDQPAPSLKDGVRAAYASLNPNGGAIPAAQPQASQGGLGLPQLIEIAGNKWAMQDPVVSSVVGSLIQNELGARKPMSAMEKAQLEGVLLDNQAKRKPETTDDTTEYGLYVKQMEKVGQPPLNFLEYQQALRKAGTPNNYGSIPSGYRLKETPEGALLEAIPGGPEDTTAQDDAKLRNSANDAATLQQSLNSLSDVMGSADTPVFGTLSRPFAIYSGSSAGKARSYLKQVTSGVALDAMMRLKEASKQGATGFGALSERELEILVSKMGALDPDTTDPQIIKETLDNIQRVIDQVKKTVPPEKIKEWGLEALAGENRDGDIPQEAADMLRANPETAEQFDQIFGAGSAAKILGGN